MDTDPMTLLSNAARDDKPRLFALYGVTHGPEPHEILGWGMAFPDDDTTVFYNPNSKDTHHANNPDQLLRLFRNFADVRVDWVDGG